MNFLTPRKTKTKKDKNLNFAGVVDYLAINILLKFKSHILISSEVIRGKKNRDMNFVTKRDITL